MELEGIPENIVAAIEKLHPPRRLEGQLTDAALVWEGGPERDETAWQSVKDGDLLLCIVENATSGEQEIACVVYSVDEGTVSGLYLAGTTDDWAWGFDAVSWFAKLTPAHLPLPSNTEPTGPKGPVR